MGQGLIRAVITGQTKDLAGGRPPFCVLLTPRVPGSYVAGALDRQTHVIQVVI